MEAKKQRAAVYARCSSLGPGDDIALAHQLDMCYAYCSNRAYTICEQYVCYDVGAGDPMCAPQLSRLRQGAAEGQIDVVVIASADCIDELPAWQVIVIGEFEKGHVRVESALEGHGTHLVVQQIITDTDMAVAQILSERVTRSQRRRKKVSHMK